MDEIRSTEERAVRVCDYVEVSWPEVVARLSSPTIDDLLTRALRDVVGDDDAPVVHAATPELVVGGTARVEVSWRVGDVAGTATVVVLPVQTGTDVVTELVIDIVVGANAPATVATVTRRFVARVVDRLAA
jgi:hypothetical protein